MSPYNDYKEIQDITLKMFMPKIRQQVDQVMALWNEMNSEG